MIELLTRATESGVHCATCRHYRTKETPPSDFQPAPYCFVGDFPLDASRLAYTFCVRWERLPDDEAVAVFEELTGLTL